MSATDDVRTVPVSRKGVKVVLGGVVLVVAVVCGYWLGG